MAFVETRIVIGSCRDPNDTGEFSRATGPRVVDWPVG